MNAYEANRMAIHLLAIESSLIGPAMVSLMKGRRQCDGLVGDLLKALEALTLYRTQNQRDWPRSPRKFSADLRRLSPNLRRIGIEITFKKHTKEGTPVSITASDIDPLFRASIEESREVLQFITLRPFGASRSAPRSS